MNESYDPYYEAQAADAANFAADQEINSQPRYVIKGEAKEAIWDTKKDKAVGILFDGLADKVLQYLNSTNENS